MGVKEDKEIAKKIALAVNTQGGRTFYVGGYVRDSILGKENKDIDIEIHGISFDTLRQILKSIGTIDERKVGDHFGILALKGYDVDIAMPRAEKPTGNKGHKDFIIEVDPFIGYEKACKRRDFTINSMMQDVLTGEIIDIYQGRRDLLRGLIKYVDKDTFIDDPLRVLRATQFAARFNFRLSNSTVELCKNIDITKLSHERIAGELDKALLKAEKPHIFFRELKKINQLSFWFPEVEKLINCVQEPSHHPEGDCFTHTMMVLDEAAEIKNQTSGPRAFMLSALCHDFGKPFVTEYSEEKSKWTAYSHDEEGVEPARNFIKRIYNDKDLEKYVTNMVELHMKPNLYHKADSSYKKFNVMFDKSINPDDLLLLAECDHKGRLYVSDYTENKEYLNKKLEGYKEIMKEPEVTGNDLIELGYEPSPKFTEMLKYTHNCHLKGLNKDLALRNMMGEFGKPKGKDIEEEKDDIELD